MKTNTMSKLYQRLCSSLINEFPKIKFLETSSAQLKYGGNSLGYNRVILGAIYPRTHEEVSRIVILANSHKISLYPISTGHNWGYGSATPILDDCVIVELSLMNVIEFDNESGLVTLEPGVTLHQLWNYLNNNQYPWIVPVTGAGYIGSLMGNALDRGFGIAPTSDHCSAIMSLKAVIADGSTYESLHESLAPKTKLGQLYKWGLGAYCDGLFTQSNFGIVTKTTIALRKQPQEISVCLLGLKEQNLNHAIVFVKYMNQEFSGNLGFIQILNKERFITVNPKADKSIVHDWNIVVVLYGQRKIIQHIHSVIKKKCKLFSSKSILLSESKIKMILRMPSFILRMLERITKISVSDLKELFDFYRGKPSNFGIKSHVYSDRTDDISNTPLDIEIDNKGIIWFAPLIPQTHEDLVHFIALVTPIFIKYEIKFSITLTSFYGNCFDGTIPLFFNRQDKSEEIKTQECYNELLTVCIKNEYIPYRLGIQSMKIMGNSLHYDMVEKIKVALDPNNILAPGRYH